MDKDLKKYYQNKFTFIGFILGILPFFIILLLTKNSENNLTIFNYTIAIAGFITAIINSLCLRNLITKKINESSLFFTSI